MRLRHSNFTRERVRGRRRFFYLRLNESGSVRNTCNVRNCAGRFSGLGPLGGGLLSFLHKVFEVRSILRSAYKARVRYLGNCVVGSLPNKRRW